MPYRHPPPAVRAPPPIGLRLAAVALGCILFGCGGSGPKAAPAVAHRFEPLSVPAGATGSFRILGEGFGARGVPVDVVCTAAEGRPFLGGRSDTLLLRGEVESARQIRGLLSPAGIPRGHPSPVAATVTIGFAGGRVLPMGGLPVEFACDTLRVSGTRPEPLPAGRPGLLAGSGFSPAGGLATIRLDALHGAPFPGAQRTAVLAGEILSPEEIAFVVPEVRGIVHCLVHLRLDDGAEARSEDWMARIEGERPPLPLLFGLTPAAFDGSDPVVLRIDGEHLGSPGLGVRVVFVADDANPFRGGTTDRIDVPGLILSPSRIRAVSPFAPVADVVSAHLLVLLPDGTEIETTPQSLRILPHHGQPRLGINEVDYDQPGVDRAEFVELVNAGDGVATLSAHVLEIINGSGGAADVLRRIPLPPRSLARGDFFVVSTSAALVPRTDLDVLPDTNLLQNGAPDAVLLRGGGGQVLDVLSYEGRAGVAEGGGTMAEDPGDETDLSLQRIVDGLDTDSNSLDFGAFGVSPGLPNSGSGEEAWGVIGEADFTPRGTLLRWNPRTGAGVALPGPLDNVALGGIAFSRGQVLHVTTLEAEASRLLRVRPSSGELLLEVGRISCQGVGLEVLDLGANQEEDRLYALARASESDAGIYAVDPMTASATLLLRLPLGPGDVPSGLACDGAGEAFATIAGPQPVLLRVSLVEQRTLSSTPLDLLHSQGLARRPSDGVLFCASEGPGAIHRLDRDGRVTPLGWTGVPVPADLAFRPLP